MGIVAVGKQAALGDLVQTLAIGTGNSWCLVAVLGSSATGSRIATGPPDVAQNLLVVDVTAQSEEEEGATEAQLPDGHGGGRAVAAQPGADGGAIGQIEGHGGQRQQRMRGRHRGVAQRRQQRAVQVVGAEEAGQPQMRDRQPAVGARPRRAGVDGGQQSERRHQFLHDPPRPAIHVEGRRRAGLAHRVPVERQLDWGDLSTRKDRVRAAVLGPRGRNGEWGAGSDNAEERGGTRGNAEGRDKDQDEELPEAQQQHPVVTAERREAISAQEVGGSREGCGEGLHCSVCRCAGWSM